MRSIDRGANRLTGNSVEITLDAASATAAERVALDLGLLVSEVLAEPPRPDIQPPCLPPVMRPPIRSGDVICPNSNCRYSGPPKLQARGTALIPILLILAGLPCLGLHLLVGGALILFGILYIVLFSGHNAICPHCGLFLRPGPHR